MQLTRLAPAGAPPQRKGNWTLAASALLHVAAFVVLLGLTARRPPPEETGAGPSYDLVFDDGQAGASAPSPALPPAQPAEIPVPDDTPLGPPAPVPTSVPDPAGVPSPAPESATAAVPPPATASAPPQAEAGSPPEAAPGPPALAAAPEAVPAEPVSPEPAEVAPPPAPPPTVRLQTPTAPEAPPANAFTMPQPPAPLPPAPPRPRITARPAPGTLANPLDLSLAPSAPRPAPAARGSVAANAINLSPGPPRSGSSSSDPYATARGIRGKAGWEQVFREYWLAHRFYPQQASAAGEQGTVVLQMQVNRSGQLESLDVASTSGSRAIDMAALATFRGIHFPPLTNEAVEEHIPLTLSITYQLIGR